MHRVAFQRLTYRINPRLETIITFRRVMVLLRSRRRHISDPPLPLWLAAEQFLAGLTWDLDPLTTPDDNLRHYTFFALFDCIEDQVLFKLWYPDFVALDLETPDRYTDVWQHHGPDTGTVTHQLSIP